MTGLELPATIDSSTVPAWSDEVDVVVIGFGIGGGCAALCARRRKGQAAPERLGRHSVHGRARTGGAALLHAGDAEL